MFVIASAEYLSMTAGEAKNPRKTMARAFRTVLVRVVVFYIRGALSVSILIAYNDPVYLEKASDHSDGASSPYVVAMQNMGIDVLPHIVNALIVSSAFSAGLSYTYCSSRALYGLSVKGFVPRCFQYCTKLGVPIFCVGVSIAFSFLALMALGQSGMKVLNFMVSLVTGSMVLNYAQMGYTYLCFYRACKVQGINRDEFTFKSWFQPYGAIAATTILTIMVGVLGYETLMPGRWDLPNFLLLFVFIAIFVAWKLFKRTLFIKPEDADLRTGLADIEEHEFEFYAELEAKGKPTPTLLNKTMGCLL